MYHTSTSSESEWLFSLPGPLLGDDMLGRLTSASARSRKGSDPFLCLPLWREWCDAADTDADAGLNADGCIDVSISADNGAN
jgi:hypothetical protein